MGDIHVLFVVSRGAILNSWGWGRVNYAKYLASGNEILEEAEPSKGGYRHKNWCMTWVLNFLIRYFSNYYILHRRDLAAWAAPLDPRLPSVIFYILNIPQVRNLIFWWRLWTRWIACLYRYSVTRKYLKRSDTAWCLLIEK